MLKKMIVGVLVATVAIAIGASLYLADAAASPETNPQVDAQIEISAARSTTPVEAAVVVEEETVAEVATQGTPIAVDHEPAQLMVGQGQGQGFGSGGAGNSGAQGGERGAGAQGAGTGTQGTGQGTQNGSGASGSGTQVRGNGGQGAGGSSGRPAWAGTGQGAQP